MDRRSVDLVHRTMDLFHAFFNRKIIQKIFKNPSCRNFTFRSIINFFIITIRSLP
jgi:hypothetical protein